MSSENPLKVFNIHQIGQTFLNSTLKEPNRSWADSPGMLPISVVVMVHGSTLPSAGNRIQLVTESAAELGDVERWTTWVKAAEQRAGRGPEKAADPHFASRTVFYIAQRVLCSRALVSCDSPETVPLY